jgi:hypothetical protein
MEIQSRLARRFFLLTYRLWFFLTLSPRLRRTYRRALGGWL